MSNDSSDQLAANISFAIPRPSPEDVRAFMEFLADRHPHLLDALARTADALVAEGVDLRHLLGEVERPISPVVGSRSLPPSE